MKQLSALAISAFAWLCAAGASEVILEDDFTQGDAGPVLSREPLTGNFWQGLAEVKDGALVHGADIATRSAFVELELPADATMITFHMEGHFEPGGQFAFGFTNDPKDLSGEGENNRGLIWGGFAGRKVTIFGGQYAHGGSLNADLHEVMHAGPFNLELTAKIVSDESPVAVRFSFNDREILTGEVLPTQIPYFSNLFIQFRDAEGRIPNRSTIHRVKVTVD